MGLFLLLLTIGLVIYGHYGISWDEFISRDNGMITLRFLRDRFAPDFLAADEILQSYRTPLVEYFDRDYGVVFETPVALLERVLELNDPHEQFLLRHLMTFLVCFGGSIAFFQLVRRRFADWRLGLFGALWFVLSPRLFGEWFYNDKDAVFMALFVVATNTLARFVLKPTFGRAVWHALACAVTIDVRVMGVVLPAVTVGFLLVQVVRGRAPLVRSLGALLTYAGLLVAFVVAFWPYLWAAPLDNFLRAFDNMKHFRWHGLMLYRGELVMSTELPWHYVPVWIGVTTPLLYLVCFVGGAVLILTRFARHFWRFWDSDQELQDLLFLALALGPVLAVIVMKSVLYDGWRQLYFVYPYILLVALSGWISLWGWLAAWSGRGKWQTLLGIGTGAYLVFMAAVMVRMHPLQSLYFNALAGKDTQRRFEGDYWGISYRMGLKYLLKTDDRPVIKVWHISPIWNGWNMLKPAERERISIVNDENDADYFMSTYRSKPDDYAYPNEYHQIRVGNTRVLSIFKLK